MVQTILKVEGMSCSHCVNAVTKAVTALAGVSGVKVDLEGKTATVEYDENQVSLDSIRDAIEEEGYDVG
jgi:copper chaperone